MYAFPEQFGIGALTSLENVHDGSHPCFDGGCSPRTGSKYISLRWKGVPGHRKLLTHRTMQMCFADWSTHSLDHLITRYPLASPRQEGDAPRYAVMLTTEPGEERRHVSIRRENLAFVDARAEWEERLRVVFASKPQPHPDITPGAAACGAAGPDVETPPKAARGKQKPAKVDAAKAPPVLSAECRVSLRAAITEAQGKTVKTSIKTLDVQ